MSILARLMYRALVWKERQRAQRARSTPSERPAPPLAVDAARGSESKSNLIPAHLEIGRRGETLAYWYLRQAGYTVVARNRRPSPETGELDLVAWDGPVLAFVEVKTRTSTEAGPPEAAVKREQRRRIVKAAKTYMRRLRRKDVTYRFDMVSVVHDERAGLQVRLIKDAFKER